MKKQEPTQVKFLHKKFHFLNKSDIAVIYDFCEQDFSKTEKILTVAKDTRSPQSIIKNLLQRPQKSQSILSSFQKRYDEQYGHLLKVDTELTKKGSLQNTLNFFKYIPKDVLLGICMYLDPYSMANFSMTSSKISKFYLSETFGCYYRQLCLNLFQKVQSRFPQPSRFIQVRSYVMKPGNGFGPNSKNAVTNNLRYYVWQRAVSIEKRNPASLLSFGSYKNLFFKLPRVHFNGIYVCKHQYRKQQQKNLITNTMQVHVVSYYRYFRFFQDGSIVSAVYPTKQKLDQISEQLSQNLLNIDAEKVDKSIMIGEFFQQQNIIFAKLFKQGTIFSYELEINKSDKDNKNQISNILLVKKYYLKVVDEKQIVQILQEYNQKLPMYFKYIFSLSIRRQNSKLVKSSSL